MDGHLNQLPRCFINFAQTAVYLSLKSAAGNGMSGRLIVMSMWSFRWHFTDMSATGTRCNIKSYSLSHSWTLWWSVRWLEQWRLQVAAELQQRWRRTNRRRKSIPRSSSSHREGSIIQRDELCARYDRHCWSKWKVLARYDGAVPLRQRYARTHNRNGICLELSANVVLWYYTVSKKTSPTFLAITRESIDGFL